MPLYQWRIGMSVSLYLVETPEPSADPIGRNLAAWSALVGLLLWAVLAGPFFAGRVYTADDLGALHLPLRAFYAQQLASGQPYDWMPSVFSGFYLTGEGQAGVYHPLHQLFYRFLPLRAALGWEYLLSYPLMMLGAWFWLRRRLERHDAAALGALVFTFSSFNLLHFVHPNAVAIVAHIPWLLWAIDVVLTDSRRRRVTGAAALVALLTGSELLIGYPQYVLFSLLAETAYAAFLLIVCRYDAKVGCDLQNTCDDCIGCTARTWPRLVIAKEIGVLLGAVQLMPTLEAWLLSARQSADASFAAWGSLHPLNVLQLVAPYLFVGRVVGDNPHEFGLYAGVVPLMMVAWVVARRHQLGRWAPLAWLSLGFAALMLLLSFGHYGGLQRLMAWLPVLGTLRFPCRHLVLFQLACAMLTAIGFLLLVVQCNSARDRRRHASHSIEYHTWQTWWRDYEPLWCIVAISAAVAGVGLVFSQGHGIASIPAILAGPALMLTGAVLVIAAARGHGLALVALVLLAAVDQGYYGLSYSVYAPGSDNYRRLDDFVAAVRTPSCKPDGRIVETLYRFDQPGLRVGDQATLRGWQLADGYIGLEPRRRLNYDLLPALRVAGVRWVRQGPSTKDIAHLQPRPNGWLEVPEPLPRARLVTQTKTSREPDIDITRIRPDDTALTETPLKLPASKPGTAAIVAERPGRIEIAVQCPAHQLLVVAESYHRGWMAFVDGQPLAVHRVNGDFMGCEVERGKHRVLLCFQPDSLDRGWMATCLGLACVSLCFLGVSAPPKPRPVEENPS